ncbi:MAG: lactonase family protein [Planctomycetaceae bacterium]|nr:lactonase family protein [Planctomycetaceae bacterium]
MKHIILMTAVVPAMFAGILFNNTPIVADDELVPVYLGTYTGGEDGAKGIYLTQLNPQDGSLTEAQLVAEVPNPAFLAKHPLQPRLYAVTEQGHGDGSPVHAFAIDPVSFALTKLNEQSVPAFGACHLGVFPLPVYTPINSPTPDGAPPFVVVVAYYNDGATASLPLTPDGQLAPYQTLIKHEGSSSTQRQTQAHAHAVYEYRPGIVAVPDLGTDKVFFFAARPNGAIEKPLASFTELAIPSGSGPRHAVFSQELKTGFVLNELNSTICVIAYGVEAPSGILTKPEIVQVISTLPEGASAENNYTAEIFLHQNGRFLYASNRGNDSIALFHFDAATQRLTFIGTTSCGGSFPRSFDLSPCGKWLIVAAQQSDLVTTFHIDPDSGRLTPTGHTIQVKQPACVLPIMVEP